MFIINLIYKVPLEELDKALVAHRDYLDQQYALGNFLASGPKQPRTGGIILSGVSDREKLLEIVEQDPFIINELVDYELIEFSAIKTSDELAFLRED